MVTQLNLSFCLLGGANSTPFPKLSNFWTPCSPSYTTSHLTPLLWPPPATLPLHTVAFPVTSLCRVNSIPPKRLQFL